MKKNKQKNQFTEEMALELAQQAKMASREMALVVGSKKNDAIQRMAALLEEHKKEILAANQEDMDRARQSGMDASKINRLVFDESKIHSRVRSLLKIANLPDPIGGLFSAGRMDNGIRFAKMRVPLGVIFMLFESRPHVALNAGALAIKSGNAIVLKGGSEASHCLGVVSALWQRALEAAGLPLRAVQVIALDHKAIGGLLSRDDLIDLVIPRGGKELIRAVCDRSRIPVIKHFEGNCHIYVDASAELQKAQRIMLDSKLLMPSVCNAAESLLVHRSWKSRLAELLGPLLQKHVEIRGCSDSCALVPGLKPADEQDFCTEYLDRIYSLRMVDSLEQAIEHINQYGSGHTDCIVTDSHQSALRFENGVDSSVVLVNASTMYCDGESLGMGAEIGISTDKLHARGPMGLLELTTYKFVLRGDGQVMGEEVISGY